MMHLAIKFDLSSYDAAYLELAKRFPTQHRSQTAWIAAAIAEKEGKTAQRSQREKAVAN